MENAAIPMPDEQHFLFDLKGWILLPGILMPDECAAVAEHLQTLRTNRESLPSHHRNSYAGPCQILLDHPAIVGVLREIICGDTGAESYGFRCDNSFWTIRDAGWKPGQGPHNGGPGMGPTHEYRFGHGRMLSPSTRVAWEMNPVRRGDGGTLFLSGSHKSNYPIPEGYRDYTHPIYEDYDCPAGSAVIFSENVCHSSAPWTNPTTQRITVFNHYMHWAMKFHKGTPPHEAIMEMPLRRRSLFRGVWMADFPPGKIVPNDYYDEENRAL